MTRRTSSLQRGALVCLALLWSAAAAGDDELRERIHREYRHQSYMLIEDEDGWTLYVFTDGRPRMPQDVGSPDPEVAASLAMTRSSAARERVLGLVALAGAPAPEALDMALQLLNDPSAAVREEAGNLILDHPDGTPFVALLGLADDDLE